MHEGIATRQVLVIGGACGDMLLGVPRMPLSGEDVEAKDNGLQIGGCAFNVARVLIRLGASVLNGMPVGNGTWGNAVETAMKTLHLPVIMRHSDMDNGWCLALAEPGGERTFISITGCEAHITSAMLQRLQPAADTLIYVNGYELFGTGGAALRAWVLAQPQQKLIDFGPRLPGIPPGFITALFGSRTILTLNRDEARYLLGEGDIIALAQQYAARSGLTLICRLDKEGAWICLPNGVPEAVAPYPVTVVDSIGAGDAHCGGLLAGLSAGWPLTQAVDLANRVAACMVAIQGSSQPPDWNTLQEYFPDAAPLPAFPTR